MRYNSESLEIYVVINGNVLLFKDIKISLGLLITAWKMNALFRENRYLKVSTTTNNLINLCFRTQNSEQILVLSILLNKKMNVISSPCKSCDFRWGFSHICSPKLLSSLRQCFTKCRSKQAYLTALARNIVVFIRFNHILNSFGYSN